jgi:hypothetical protein
MKIHITHFFKLTQLFLLLRITHPTTINTPLLSKQAIQLFPIPPSLLTKNLENTSLSSLYSKNPLRMAESINNPVKASGFGDY